MAYAENLSQFESRRISPREWVRILSHFPVHGSLPCGPRFALEEIRRTGSVDFAVLIGAGFKVDYIRTGTNNKLRRVESPFRLAYRHDGLKDPASFRRRRVSWAEVINPRFVLVARKGEGE